MNQSYTNYEIIIVYDDEDLSDFDYLKELFKSINKIRMIKNLQNTRAGLSRNKGIVNARGKFIAFLDADDIWKKHKLNQINFMKKRT